MQRLPGLDLLRAIAIVWVMLFHSYIVGGLGPDYSWLSRYGWMGVDLFFVLSGFLIGGQVLKPLAQGRSFGVGEFYLRRALRILPAYFVVLAIYAWLPGWRESPGMQPWWQFATFSMNLLIDYEHNKAFSHAWSLCVEEHFYLVFPLLAWCLMRRPAQWKFMATCTAIVLGGIALRSWIIVTAGDDYGFVEDLYYPTWNRLDGLLAGVVLATIQVFRPATWARLQAKANLAMLAGLAIVAGAFWMFSDRVGLLGNSLGWPVLSLGLALLVLAGSSTRSWIGRWRLPAAGWLAATSFSLYLSHKLAFHGVDAAFGEQMEGQGVAAFAVFAVVTLAVGAVLHYAVERPFLQWRQRLLARRILRTRVIPEAI